MARGKEALQAERRRYEAAVSHLDRITNELVDYKLRTRACEDAARRVPYLLGEIARLEELADRHSSERLDLLQEKADAEIAELELENEKLKAFFRKIIEHDQGVPLSDEDIDFINARSLTITVNDYLGKPSNRDFRRALGRGQLATSSPLQGNGKTRSENMVVARGTTTGL